MDHGRHNIFQPLTVLLMIAASFICFLPAAISMNTQVPYAASQGTASADTTFPAEGADLHALKNKKGSLSLETAAIVGSSAAVAAAVLAGTAGANATR